MKRIQTRVAADLTKYTENFFFGMSARQTVLSVLGAAVTAAAYILSALPGIAAIGLGLPLFALAFLKPDGLALEKWAANWIQSALLRPAVRAREGGSELYEFLWNGRLLGRKVLKRRELSGAEKREGRGHI